jgi:hypothetical protein
MFERRTGKLVHRSEIAQEPEPVAVHRGDAGIAGSSAKLD